MLHNNDATATALKSGGGVQKTYKEARNRVLSELNVFFKNVKRDLPTVQLKVDFSNGGSLHNMRSLFGENYLVEMLEAFDFKHIDQVSTFLGAIEDIFCENEGCC